MSARRSPCPIAFALDLFGDRWTLLVIRDIATYGRRRFSEFEAAGEGIATNILADRLKLLVAEGVLKKQRDPEHGSRRLYSLTEKGVDLLPILLEMIVWSARHDPDSPVGADFYRRATEDREALLEEMRGLARAPQKPGS